MTGRADDASFQTGVTRLTNWCAYGAALLSIALAVAVTGCQRSSRRSSELVPQPELALAESVLDAMAPSHSVQQPSSEALQKGRGELTWSFETGPFGPTDVVVSVPPVHERGARFPVLVALHGRGESAKGHRRGARGWIDDYHLERAMTRLRHPPLKKRDFHGYVSEQRLEDLNRSLDERAYRGLIVVCPYLPDVLGRDEAFREAERLAGFIVERLLPRVYEKTPAIGTAATTGIDGVSLGGRAALLIGLARPLAFGTVGALQAALDDSEIPSFTALAAQALATNPGLELRLLTSDRDYFRRVNQRLSAAFTSRGIPHGYLRVQGTHSYRFNRGPGGLEMLLFHDRALRGLPVP